MSRILKIIKEKRGGKQHFSSPPLVVPVGAVVPETASQTMARLMLNSGVISRDDYEKMLGVRYDIDNEEGVVYEDDAYDFEDDFKLSEWSEYEREEFVDDDNNSNMSVSDDVSTRNSGDSEPDSEINNGKEKNIEGSASAETNSTTS